jgi:hypothetical protein
MAGAIAVLEPAVLLELRSWRGHELLGEGYFRQQQFEKARQQAEVAIRDSGASEQSAQRRNGTAIRSPMPDGAGDMS